jgi:hypothetical protein
MYPGGQTGRFGAAGRRSGDSSGSAYGQGGEEFEHQRTQDADEACAEKLPVRRVVSDNASDDCGGGERD